MISKSYNFFLGILIVFLFSSLVFGEDKIDIWKNKKIDNNVQNSENSDSIQNTNKVFLKENQTVKPSQSIKIEDGLTETTQESEVFGIYDPADFNFNLNMWSSTKAEDVRASIKRINKINLSKTSNEILENILLSFSYPPNGMDSKEFVSLKVNWMIENDRRELIEDFLKQNQEFNGKKRAVQYLVDQNISEANIKKGCEKIEFIDSTIKDSYLEKFKIYCLVFNKKNSQAQLLLDLLREQKQSDQFFDDKINFLLGISNKTSNKINEKNLLNFYLSSVTVKDFKYTPTKKTKKEIWRYLNSANLIKLEDINDKQKIIELEVAANKGKVDQKIIFDIYKQIPFSLNTLINAKNVYQTFEPVDARSLIFQKYLLSENIESKVEYLFLLEDLFKKNDLQNIYSKYLSEALKNIGIENIPKEYKEIAEKRIFSYEETKLGKVKYNDKILHQSKVIKFYLENEEKKKVQKDIDKILKKLSKNRKYFYSAKDLALINSLKKDGFTIPDKLKFDELTSKYDVPKNLQQLIQGNQNAFLALKIVEIIGEDEPYQLDPETILFITSLLNQIDLVNIRNKVLVSALPQRV